jgi:hypothetical protein
VFCCTSICRAADAVTAGRLSSWEVAVIVITYVPGAVTFNTLRVNFEVKGVLPDEDEKVIVENN